MKEALEWQHYEKEQQHELVKKAMADGRAKLRSHMKQFDNEKLGPEGVRIQKEAWLSIQAGRQTRLSTEDTVGMEEARKR